MKKHIYLSLFFLSLSFVVNAQLLKSHTFYSHTYSNGKITQQFALDNCNQTFSSSQLTGRSYVNINLVNPLTPNKFYYLNFGQGYNYYYLTHSSNNQHNDEDYTLIISASNDIEQITCPSYKSHTFYSHTYSNGKITQQYALDNCNQTFSSTQLTGRSYVNIYLSNPLTPNKFYYLNFGQGYNYYYLTHSSNNTHNDEDYSLSTPNGILNVVCPITSTDNDEDGILNADDSCPNVFGNISNFGCPGKPDYVLNDDSEIAAPAWGTYDLNYAKHSNNPIFLSRFDGGFIDIYKILIDNIGDGDAQLAPIKISFYISEDTSISNNDFKFSTTASLTEQISSGGTTTYSFAPSAKLYGSTVGNNLTYGWYNLIIVIDEDNDLQNSESDTSNNTYTIPLEYISSWTIYSKNSPKKNIQPNNTYSKNDLTINPKEHTFQMNIYDLYGRLIKTSNINSNIQKNEIIKSLQSGLYIIKTPFETKKIAK